MGTDDTGATAADPTGGGATGNNMVLVTEYQYDSGNDGGDGNVTRQTQHVDGSTTRVTTFTYDWRNRRTDTDGEVDVYERVFYDNLNRVTKVDRHNTTSGGNLIGRSESYFDDLGRTYERRRYAVNPSTGAVDDYLAAYTWYDAAGNVLKQQAEGQRSFTKTRFDGLGRATKQYVGFDLDESTYAEADDVTGRHNSRTDRDHVRRGRQRDCSLHRASGGTTPRAPAN